MSSRPRRVFTREFKLGICRNLADGSARIVTVCREQALTRSVVERWREQYQQLGEDAFGDQPAPVEDVDRSVRDELRRAQARIDALEGALGRAHLEAELLKRALAAGEAKHGHGLGGSRLGSGAR